MANPLTGDRVTNFSMKQNAINKGRSGEGHIVQLLNKWAGKNVFERRGLGKKGSDIICNDPCWPWTIECKAIEYDFWGLGKILIKEAKKKNYSFDKTFFIFRHKRKIFIAWDITCERFCAWGFHDKQCVQIINISEIRCYLFKDFLSSIRYEELAGNTP